MDRVFAAVHQPMRAPAVLTGRVGHWLLFAASTLLMLAPLRLIWAKIGPFAYGGGDGKLLLGEIAAFRRYSEPFASHLLNPL